MADTGWGWMLALVGVIIVIIIIALIFEYSTSNIPALQPLTPPIRPITNGTIFSTCSNVNPCQAGLECSSRNGGQICLTANNMACVANNQCSSGLCIRTNPAQPGICGLTQTPPVPPPPSVGTGTNMIYCYMNNVWTPRLTIPQGINFRRVSSSGDRFLGITMDQVFMYTPETNWQLISATFASPGSLVDGMIINNQVWLVYRLAQGNTLLYNLSSGNLVPFGPAGGVQRTSQNIPINIHHIDVHGTEIVFITGTTNEGTSSIYRYNPNTQLYDILSTGTNGTVVPGLSVENYAFSYQSTIYLQGRLSRTISNIQGVITDIVVTPTGIIWYLAGINLYRDGSIISTPVILTSTSSIFWSSSHELCLVP